MKQKFLYEKKRELSSGGKVTVLVTPVAGSSNYAFGAEEIELAELFDGERSTEEILDTLHRTRGVQIENSDFEDFTKSLLDAGLLQNIPEESDTDGASDPQHNRAAAGALSFAETNESQRDQSLLLLDQQHIMQRAHDRGMVDFDPDLGLFENPEFNPPNKTRRRAALVQRRATRDSKLHGNQDFLGRRDSLISEQRAHDALQDRDDELRGPVVADHLSQADEGLDKPVGLFRRPIAWLIPYAKIVALTGRHALLGGACLASAFLAAYALWNPGTVAFAELMLSPAHLPLLLWLVPALIATSFIVQLAKAATYHYYAPKGGPDNREHSAIPVRSDQQIMLASISTCLLVFAASVGIWNVFPEDQLIWRAAAFAFVAVSGVFNLQMANPLVAREGYHLLAAKLGTPELMENALRALLWDNFSVWFYGRRAVTLWTYSAVVGVYYGLIAALTYLAISAPIGPLAGLWLVAILMLTFVSAARELRAAYARAAARRETRLFDPAAHRSREIAPVIRPLLRYSLLLALLAYLGTLPYTYEAGGEFRILPTQRVDVRPLTSGEVGEVFVKEGDVVSADQAIVQLNDDQERVDIAVSRSTLDELKAKLAMAVNGATSEEIALARQRVNTAQTQLGFSSSRAKRYQDLDQKGMVSHQDYEDALKMAEVDREELKAANRNLDLILAGTRSEVVEEIKAAIAKEQAVLDYRNQQLANTTVLAGANGRVVSGTLMFAVGDYIKKGDIIAQIEDTRNVQSEIRIPEVDVGEIRLGAPVRLKVWAYPHEAFWGAVTSIAPSAEQTDLGKVVRVLAEIEDKNNVLRTELTGYGKIQAQQRPAFLAFTRMLARLFQVQFWSWIP